MSELVEVGVAGAPVAVVGLLLLAGAAAAVDAAVLAHAEGSPVSVGLRAPLAETARLLRQRPRRTACADRLLWHAGTASLLVAACLMVVVVPVGGAVVADLPVGVVWFNAADVLVWAGVWLAGWGPNAVHSMIGGYRFLALALAYELPLMFALTAPAVAASSLRVGEIAAAQHTVWNAVWMPLSFAVYCVGVAGFAVWGPFAAPLAEDVAGGVRVESSGPDRLLLEVGRYALLAAGALFAVPLFLGGGAGPVLPAAVWVLAKAAALLAALVTLRRRVPLLRPDRFLELGWLVLLPVSLAQLLAVCVVVLAR